MYLIDIIPATKIPRSRPQIYTYYSKHRLRPGALVLAPIYKRNIKAIVISNRKFNKLAIKKLDFNLRPIIKIISKKPILDKDLLKLAIWISDYYYEPISLVIKFLCKI